jgi:hypothetical protein
MRKHFLTTVAALVLGIGLAATVASAAGPVRVDVPFSFYLNGKEMSAGKYEILPQGQAMASLSVRPVSGGNLQLASVWTRLADNGDRKATVVFDVADGKHYLSEVFIPGSDGFALEGAPGKHTHVRITSGE